MEINKWQTFQLSTCGSVYLKNMTELDTWLVYRYLCIAVNAILTFTAIAGNVLILIALQRKSLPLHSAVSLLGVN